MERVVACIFPFRILFCVVANDDTKTHGRTRNSNGETVFIALLEQCFLPHTKTGGESRQGKSNTNQCWAWTLITFNSQKSSLWLLKNERAQLAGRESTNVKHTRSLYTFTHVAVGVLRELLFYFLRWSMQKMAHRICKSWQLPPKHASGISCSIVKTFTFSIPQKWTVMLIFQKLPIQISCFSNHVACGTKFK